MGLCFYFQRNLAWLLGMNIILADATIKEKEVNWKEICGLTRLLSHTRMAILVLSAIKLATNVRDISVCLSEPGYLLLMKNFFSSPSKLESLRLSGLAGRKLRYTAYFDMLLAFRYLNLPSIIYIYILCSFAKLFIDFKGNVSI